MKNFEDIPVCTCSDCGEQHHQESLFEVDGVLYCKDCITEEDLNEIKAAAKAAGVEV